MIKPLLEIDSITVKYGKFIALRQCSLDIDESQVVALIGPNGAGKSTLLKTIIGLLLPSEGSIFFRGECIHGLKPHKIVPRGIALAAEGHRVLPYMSVEENLFMGAYNLNDRETRGESFQRAYDLFPILWERKDQLAGTLSGGEQQMLGVGTALVSKPDLLLLDEPSMGLAPKVYSDIIDALRIVRSQGVTILISEQNAKCAMDIADYVYILQNGRVFIEDVPENLKNNPEVAEVYLAIY